MRINKFVNEFNTYKPKLQGKEHGLRLSERRVLRRIFGPKK
jgi:hypothetical protein